MMCTGKKSFLIVVLLICVVSIASSQETIEATFAGKVLDAQGEPVAGATAKLYDEQYGLTTYPYKIADVIETTTNSNGEFTFRRQVGNNDYPYGFIVVEKEGFALDCISWDMRDENNKEGQFELGDPEELTGTVFDENNKLVSEATVSCLLFRIGDRENQHNLSITTAPVILNTSTNETGRFTFKNIPADASVEFLIQKEGKATVCTYNTSTSSGDSYQFTPDRDDIQFTLPVESRIEGTVIDSNSGQPVAGVNLSIRQGSSSRVYGQGIITSDENGRFTISGLAAGSYNIIYAPAREGIAEWVAQPVYIDLEAGQTEKDVKLELGEGGFLEALVTESGTNKPLEGARVSLYSERVGQSFGGDSDKEGIVLMRLLPGVYSSIFAYKQGYSSLNLQETINIEEGSTKRLEWQLSPAPSLSGIVRDENDKPIEGASLNILPGGGSNAVTSDSEGKYKINWNIGMLPGLEQEIPLLVCRYKESNLATVVMLDAGTKTLDIKLKPGITIRGKVSDPLGKPIADARIRMMLRQTMWASTFIRSDMITTDAEGNYEVSAIPSEHRYQINVSADGYGSDEIEIHADNAINNILDVNAVTLPIANLTVSGIVVDTEDNPIANARIESYNYESNQPESLSTQTDSQGRFTFEGVCEGEFNIRVRTNVNGRSVNARAIAFGGAADIKIVATEGTSSPVQYIRSESYEEILQNSENVLAGVVVDEDGSPVSDIPVGVCCVKSEYEPGRYRWMFSNFSEFSAITDEQGRFAIPLDTDNERYKGEQYNLRFSPQGYAADIVYDIPIDIKDIKVVLSKGGTLSGKLVRIEKGEKVPIANAEVKLEQESRAAYTHLGFDRDQTAITDAQGRFKFERIQTKIRPGGSRSDIEWEPVPRVWVISYGDVSESVAFYDGITIDDFELVVNPTESLLSVGNSLPDFDGIILDLPEEQIEDKMVLVCFFDYEQRPSRNCIMQLNARAQELKAQDVEIVTVHASKIEQDILDEWIKKNDINFPVGMIEENEEQTRVNWGVESLPWLILTDEQHTVTAEGFSINELDEKIEP